MNENEPENTGAGWKLILYVSGMTPASKRALGNIEEICEQNLPKPYSLAVVDIRERPDLAEDEQIIAVPTLIRKLPLPVRKVIGDFSEAEKVLVGLEILPRG